LDAACAWLADRGMEAARAGFGLLETPFTTDDYETLPPSTLRQNPREYHALIKGAGFETEQGFVDYAIEVTPALLERWSSTLQGVRRSGVEIVPLREWPAAERARELSEIWNETFASHFGWCPLSPEITELFVQEGSPALETSVFALEAGRPIGFCFVLPDDASHATFAPGRALRPSEKLNILAIGVRKPARGRGINYAMAAYGLLELVRQGWTHVSYTLVLDDNWPSRRTGEGLGGSLCANYVAYRRNFRRR
ncbi:MAG: hypothetical protein ACREI8_02390, partial [Myxococcota bacterium]